MVNQEKIALKQRRQETSLDTMYFNRYLLIRYMTAAYFFSNMHWAFLLIGYHQMTAIIPITLFLVGILVVIEQVKKYWHKESRLPFAKYYYYAQGLVNLVGILSYLTPFSDQLFPFMSAKGMLPMILWLGLGLVGCVILEKRIHAIEQNKDRALTIIKEYEATLK